MEIDYKGNRGGKGKKTDPKRKSAKELANSETYVSSHRLRLRLIEDGIKETRCECCKLSEWMGKPIPLELHHKDGNHYNNELAILKYYVLIAMLKLLIIHVEADSGLHPCEFESHHPYKRI